MAVSAQFKIEDFTAGFLAGWFNDVEAESSGFEIEANGKVICAGNATIFRKDLLDAGFGDGKKAFRVFIDDKLTGFGEIKIRLKDANGQVAAGDDFILFREEPKLQFEFLRQDPLNLFFNVNAESMSQSVRLQVNAGKEIVSYINLNIRSGKSQITVSAPLSIMDGIERLISIGLEGSSLCLWQGHAKFLTNLTPREHLKNPHLNSRLLNESPQSGFRYASLKLWLDCDISLEHLRNIQAAHNVLSEGWYDRKQYKTLCLPACSKPTVSIVIPAYNKFELTYHCIASIILAFNRTSYEVILADDCSDDETVEADSIIENLVISKTSENLMFLKNCNNAAKQARGKFILFLNNDTEVTSYWLDELMHIAEDSHVGLLGSKLLNEDGSLQEAGGIVWDSCKPWNVGNGSNPNSPEYNYVRHADYLSGAALCIRREVWEEVGGFSEYLAPAYFEDTDIAYKVRDAGFDTLYVPHSEVFHFEGMTHGRDLTNGVKKNQVINFDKFAKRWAHQTRFNGKEGFENLQIEKDRKIQKRILVIDYTMPDIKRDAGSYAAVQEIKLLQSLGFKVTFAADNLAHLGETTTDLQRMGVEVLFAPFYISIEQMLASRLNEMDAVYITRYYVAEKCIDRIKAINPRIPVLFNNADLHFLRELRASGSQEAIDKALETKTKEIGICNKVDAILCYNTTEHAVIASHLNKKGNFHVTPWVLQEKADGPDFKARDGIVFLGGFGHYPNVEAVEYLATKIMPLLQEVRPEIKLYVYGSKMPKEFNDYTAENIEMVGFAESLDDVYNNHRVFVAPLLSGAGIKGKVLEALVYGLPCVLTDIAAEGTGLSNGVSCFNANSPQEWVDCIIKLYDDKKVWTQFAANEKLLANEQYSAEHGRRKFTEILASVGIYVGN